MTSDTAHPNLCYQCGKVVHKDKVLADQCRLMTAILGQGWGDRNIDDIGVESSRSKSNIKAVKEVILSISTEGQIVGLDRDNRDCSETKKSIDLSASSCFLEEDFVTPASSFEMDGEGSCVSDADAQLLS